MFRGVGLIRSTRNNIPSNFYNYHYQFFSTTTILSSPHLDLSSIDQKVQTFQKAVQELQLPLAIETRKSIRHELQKQVPTEFESTLAEKQSQVTEELNKSVRWLLSEGLEKVDYSKLTSMIKTVELQHVERPKTFENSFKSLIKEMNECFFFLDRTKFGLKETKEYETNEHRRFKKIDTRKKQYFDTDLAKSHLQYNVLQYLGGREQVLERMKQLIHFFNEITTNLNEKDRTKIGQISLDEIKTEISKRNFSKLLDSPNGYLDVERVFQRNALFDSLKRSSYARINSALAQKGGFKVMKFKIPKRGVENFLKATKKRETIFDFIEDQAQVFIEYDKNFDKDNHSFYAFGPADHDVLIEKIIKEEILRGTVEPLSSEEESEKSRIKAEGRKRWEFQLAQKKNSANSKEKKRR